MAEHWEYKFLLCEGGENMEATLAPLGAEGWEAVGFAPVLNVPTKFTHAPKSEGESESIILTVTEWGAQVYRVLLKRRKQP